VSYESDDFGLLSDADVGFSDEVPLLPLPSVEDVLDSPSFAAFREPRP
jgi:hypothetical protein